MSDLCVYKFEDTVWGDHVVPYPGSEHTGNDNALGSEYKKPYSEVTKDTSTQDRYNSNNKEEKGITMLDKGASSQIQPIGIQLSSSKIESIKEASATASDNDSSLCLNNSNADANGSEFSDTTLSRKTTGVGNNSFSYPLGDIARGDSLDLLRNAEEKDPDDFLYYGWPEIGNFEGVDNMLRSCDSEFVEEDLGWFSSANHKSNCRSPSPVSKMAENLSENHKSSNCYSVDDFSMTSEVTGHNKNSSWASEKSDPYMSFVNGPANAYDRDKTIRKEQYIEKTEEDLFGKGSFCYEGSLSSEVLQLSSGATSYLASASMCIQEKRLGSDGNGNRGKKHNCERANLVVPEELDSSCPQESSTLSSGSDVISTEAASFRQLNLITERLDLRTKLCIRDSLYRLARSAQQRHNHVNGVLMSDSFMDMETGTNPIDRSVAHLLFHRPSESSTIPVDTVLLNSPAMQVHGSTTSAPVCEETAYKIEILTDG